MPSVRSSSLFLLMGLFTLAPSSARSAPSARLQALRARVTASKSKSAKQLRIDGIKWVPASDPITWRIPQDCANKVARRSSAVGAVHGLPTLAGTISCLPEREWTKALKGLPKFWSFRDGAKHAGEFTGFVFQTPSQMSALEIPKMTAGLRLESGQATASASGFFPVLMKDLSRPDQLPNDRPFVRTRIREGELEGVYLGQVKDGLAHGFGFGIFPGSYAFCGFTEEGWTQGWNLSLIKSGRFKLSYDDQDVDGFSASLGEHVNGRIQGGALANWELGEDPYSVGRKRVRALVLFQGVLNGWQASGSGVRVRNNFYSKGNILNLVREDGVFAANALVDGEKTYGEKSELQVHRIAKGQKLGMTTKVRGSSLRIGQVVQTKHFGPQELVKKFAGKVYLTNGNNVVDNWYYEVLSKQALDPSVAATLTAKAKKKAEQYEAIMAKSRVQSAKEAAARAAAYRPKSVRRRSIWTTPTARRYGASGTGYSSGAGSSGSSGGSDYDSYNARRAREQTWNAKQDNVDRAFNNFK